MDVIDARADLVRILVAKSSIFEREVSIDITSASRRDGADDVAELRIAHMCGSEFGRSHRSSKGEAFDGQVKMGFPIPAPERKPFAKCRFVNLETLAPALSRSITSSWIASAICRQVWLRDMSSRANDQFRIVTGPVGMPLTGFSVSD